MIKNIRQEWNSLYVRWDIIKSILINIRVKEETISSLIWKLPTCR